MELKFSRNKEYGKQSSNDSENTDVRQKHAQTKMFYFPGWRKCQFVIILLHGFFDLDERERNEG